MWRRRANPSLGRAFRHVRRRRLRGAADRASPGARAGKRAIVCASITNVRRPASVRRRKLRLHPRSDRVPADGTGAGARLYRRVLARPSSGGCRVLQRARTPGSRRGAPRGKRSSRWSGMPAAWCSRRSRRTAPARRCEVSTMSWLQRQCSRKLIPTISRRSWSRASDER